jgi:hypothetical protein
MKSSAAAGDSCHLHSSSPLHAYDQVQGTGYSKSEVETDMAVLQLETSATALKLETSVAALELETDATGLKLEMNAAALEMERDIGALDLEKEIGMPQQISKQERYSAD